MPWKQDVYEKDNAVVQTLLLTIKRLEEEIKALRQQFNDQQQNKSPGIVTHPNIKLDHERNAYFQDTYEIKRINDSFIWKIEDFKDRLEEAKARPKYYVQSSSFYTNQGYRICLVIFPNGFYEYEGKYLSVYFALVKGDRDADLSWPFKNNIFVEIIDKDKNKAYVKRKIGFNSSYKDTIFARPDYDESKQNRNRTFGHADVLKISDFEKCFGLWSNNILEIRISVK